MKLGGPNSQSLKGTKYAGCERIGDLLIAKAKEGVKVRVLIWDHILSSQFGDKPVITKSTSYQPLSSGSYRSISNHAEIDMTKALLIMQMKSINKPTWLDSHGSEAKYFFDHYYNYGYQKPPYYLFSERNKEVYTVLTYTLGYQISSPNDNFCKSNSRKDYQAQEMFWNIYSDTSEKERRIKLIAQYKETDNIQIRTRAMGKSSTVTPTGHIAKALDDTGVTDFYELEKEAITSRQRSGLLSFASHHQKAVLIDIEDPYKAIGFILGHNMHKNYYDDNHRFFNPDIRWSGFGPWQDNSVRVRGNILLDINRNFCKAWAKEAGEGLYAERKYLEDEIEKYNIVEGVSSLDETNAQGSEHLVKFGYIKDESGNLKQVNFLRKGEMYSLTGQITRTEPDYDEHGILDTYLNAINNARHYIYMENQYFRYGPVAEHLKKRAKLRNNKAESPLYLFVATNYPATNGVKFTFDMLDRLGHDAAYPALNNEVEEEFLTNYIESKGRNLGNSSGIYERFQEEHPLLTDRSERLLKKSDFDVYIGPVSTMKYRELVRQKGLENALEEVKRKGLDQAHKDLYESSEAEEQRQEASKNSPDEVPFDKEEFDDLKIHIACLKTCHEYERNKFIYTDIYIHSKLMLIDDVYTNLGSANINTRSFKTDTEIAVGLPSPELTRHFRENLWNIHLGGYADSSEDNFELWETKMQFNWDAMQKGNALKNFLTYFYDPFTKKSELTGMQDYDRD